MTAFRLSDLGGAAGVLTSVVFSLAMIPLMFGEKPQ